MYFFFFFHGFRSTYRFFRSAYLFSPQSSSEVYFLIVFFILIFNSSAVFILYQIVFFFLRFIIILLLNCRASLIDPSLLFLISLTLYIFHSVSFYRLFRSPVMNLDSNHRYCPSDDVLPAYGKSLLKFVIRLRCAFAPRVFVVPGFERCQALRTRLSKRIVETKIRVNLAPYWW